MKRIAKETAAIMCCCMGMCCCMSSMCCVQNYPILPDPLPRSSR